MHFHGNSIFHAIADTNERSTDRSGTYGDLHDQQTFHTRQDELHFRKVCTVPAFRNDMDWKTVKTAGAGILAVPCITAHFFHDELQDEVGLPVMNAVEETAVCLWNRGIKHVGILATEGTIQSQIFQRVLEGYGISSEIPDKEMQQIITDMIYHDIKAGKTVDIERFGRVSAELNEKGAQVVILACTELSLIKKTFQLEQDILMLWKCWLQKLYKSVDG